MAVTILIRKAWVSRYTMSAIGANSVPTSNKSRGHCFDRSDVVTMWIPLLAHRTQVSSCRFSEYLHKRSSGVWCSPGAGRPNISVKFTPHTLDAKADNDENLFAFLFQFSSRFSVRSVRYFCCSVIQFSCCACSSSFEGYAASVSGIFQFLLWSSMKKKSSI